MHIAIGEGLSRRNVEVSNDLVYFDAALEAAPFLALRIEVFGIVLTLALFNTLTATERPRD